MAFKWEERGEHFGKAGTNRAGGSLPRDRSPHRRRHPHWRGGAGAHGQEHPHQAVYGKAGAARHRPGGREAPRPR